MMMEKNIMDNDDGETRLDNDDGETRLDSDDGETTLWMMMMEKQ